MKTASAQWRNNDSGIRDYKRFVYYKRAEYMQAVVKFRFSGTSPVSGVVGRRMSILFQEENRFAAYVERKRR